MTSCHVPQEFLLSSQGRMWAPRPQIHALNSERHGELFCFVDALAVGHADCQHPA